MKAQLPRLPAPAWAACAARHTAPLTLPRTLPGRLLAGTGTFDTASSSDSVSRLCRCPPRAAAAGSIGSSRMSMEEREARQGEGSGVTASAWSAGGSRWQPYTPAWRGRGAGGARPAPEWVD